MRGLVVPERSEDFAADPVELFFDLAFVFAFSQLVQVLIVHPDWEGVGRVSLLFVLLWLPWTQFAWSANAVRGSHRSVRFAFLIATAASVPMAAAVETAFGNGGRLFAVPLAIIYLMALGVMVSGLETGSEEFVSSVRYALPNVVAMLLVVLGGVLRYESRVVAWIASLVVVVWATVRAGEGSWIVRTGHFAERHGLIIIVALGEVIVALGNAVITPLSEGKGFDRNAVIALVGTGVAAGVLWWAYFDRVQAAYEHRAESLERSELGRYVRDVYTYSHMPVVAGVIFVAAALEEATAHPDDRLALAFRMMLLAGGVMFLGGVGIGVYRAFRVIAKERLVALVALAFFLAFAESVPGVVVIIVFDIVLIAALIVEHMRIEVKPSRKPTS
jgi:low temperature requirement protein LtrA